MREEFEQASGGILRMRRNREFVVSVWDTVPDASQGRRGMILRTEGTTGVADQLAFYRKNADDTYDWVPLVATETTIVLFHLYPYDEGDSPGDVGNGAVMDPAAVGGVLNLQPYRQARLRAVIDPAGTEGVEAEVTYSIDGGNTYASLLSSAVDFGSAATTTEWEDLPAEVLAPSTYVYLNVAVTGTGTDTPTVGFYLDLRG